MNMPLSAVSAYESLQCLPEPREGEEECFDCFDVYATSQMHSAVRWSEGRRHSVWLCNSCVPRCMWVVVPAGSLPQLCCNEPAMPDGEGGWCRAHEEHGWREALAEATRDGDVEGAKTARAELVKFGRVA